MKRILIGAAVVLLLAIAAIAFSIDRIAGAAIERGATRALGVETRVGFVAVSPFEGALRVGSLRVANPPGFEGDLLRFDDFELQAELRSLRRELVNVPLFRLEGVDVTLQRRGDETNTDAILANLKRFESGGAPRDASEKKGPAQRFKVAKLVIRDVDAHVEWSSLVAKQSALDVHVDGIELANPGGERGLTLPELSNVVVKAVLDSVRRSGQLPAEVARNLAGGLRGLTTLPLSVTGGVLEGAGKMLPGAAGEVLDATGGAVRGVGDALDGLLGGKREKKD